MEKMYLRDKMILHLGRCDSNPSDDNCIASEEITQSGIALELGLSRNHVSVILLKLENEGYVFDRLSRVRHTKTGLKRKAYGLTPLGKMEFVRIVETMKKYGMPEDEIFCPNNINYYSGDRIDTLGNKDKDVLGMICVLERNVYKDTLRHVPKMLPFEGKYSSIRNETMNRILSRNTKETITYWHSLAADYCLDNDLDFRKRIYHLVSSERNVEAKQLILKNKFFVMDHPREDLLRASLTLSNIYIESEIPYIATFIALRMNRLEEAAGPASMVEKIDSDLGKALKSEILLKEGDTKNAHALALESYRGDVDTSLILGKTTLAMGDAANALFFLKKARTEMENRRCIFRMNEELYLESEAVKALGRTDESVRLSEMAYNITEAIGRGYTCSFKEQYSSSGCQDRICINRGCL